MMKEKHDNNDVSSLKMGKWVVNSGVSMWQMLMRYGKMDINVVYGWTDAQPNGLLD